MEQSNSLSYAEDLVSGARAPFLFSALARALLRDDDRAAALGACPNNRRR
jgi:hypothetical protein